ncbi:26251_t:CDS:1, partial [Gigaspora rosea]
KQYEWWKQPGETGERKEIKLRIHGRMKLRLSKVKPVFYTFSCENILSVRVIRDLIRQAKRVDSTIDVCSANLLKYVSKL